MAGGRLYAEGDNFSFELDASGILTCRVWKRPDLDAETGAALAHAMTAVWRRGGIDPTVVGGIFELGDAPPVFGPRTEEAFRSLMTRIEGKRLAMVSGESAVQRLQLQRIAAGHAHVAVVDSSADARAFATGARASMPSSAGHHGLSPKR